MMAEDDQVDPQTCTSYSTPVLCISGQCAVGTSHGRPKPQTHVVLQVQHDRLQHRPKCSKWQPILPLRTSIPIKTVNSNLYGSCGFHQCTLRGQKLNVECFQCWNQKINRKRRKSLMP